MHLNVSDYIALAALLVAIIEAVIHYCEYKKSNRRSTPNSSAITSSHLRG